MRTAVGLMGVGLGRLLEGGVPLVRVPRARVVPVTGLGMVLPRLIGGEDRHGTGLPAVLMVGNRALGDPLSGLLRRLFPRPRRRGLRLLGFRLRRLRLRGPVLTGVVLVPLLGLLGSLGGAVVVAVGSHGNTWIRQFSRQIGTVHCAPVVCTNVDSVPEAS